MKVIRWWKKGILKRNTYGSVFVSKDDVAERSEIISA
jgi:hypothetical protein